MEETESWRQARDRRKIQDLFERMVSRNMELKVDGVVRHLTKMRTEKCKDSYVMGIESAEVVENCKLASQLEANNSRAQ